MTVNEALALLPQTNGCVMILSGGMDSTIAMRLAVERYGKENVSALTFFMVRNKGVKLRWLRFLPIC